MSSQIGKVIRMNKTVEIANIHTDDHILDLGCGNNELLDFIKTPVHYIGIDKFIGPNRYDLEKGLPSRILHHKFDVIFMNEFIEHIENFKTLLNECRNCLKENGRIIITTPSNNRILLAEDPTHIHCFRKTNIKYLADICLLKVDKITGTYINFPPLSPIQLTLKTNQTIYSEVIIYSLSKA